MDDKIKAVLDEYHTRIGDENKIMRGERPAPAGGGDWRDKLLLAVGPETGQLMHILATSLKAPNILEIGTSYGYSGIWLADAARQSGGRVTTLELQDYKSNYARDMAAKAGLSAHINFQIGDAVQLIAALPFKIDFVLLDLWKDMYVPCLEAFLPKLNPGAIIVADNITRPGGEEVLRYQKQVRATPGITSVLLPVGSGIEVSRYEP